MCTYYRQKVRFCHLFRFLQYLRCSEHPVLLISKSNDKAQNYLHQCHKRRVSASISGHLLRNLSDLCIFFCLLLPCRLVHLHLMTSFSQKTSMALLRPWKPTCISPFKCVVTPPTVTSEWSSQISHRGSHLYRHWRKVHKYRLRAAGCCYVAEGAVPWSGQFP